MADELITTLIVDARLANAGASDFERAAQKIEQSSARATAAVDRLGQGVDRAGLAARAFAASGAASAGTLSQHAGSATNAAAAADLFNTQLAQTLRFSRMGAIGPAAEQGVLSGLEEERRRQVAALARRQTGAPASTFGQNFAPIVTATQMAALAPATLTPLVNDTLDLLGTGGGHLQRALRASEVAVKNDSTARAAVDEIRTSPPIVDRGAETVARRAASVGEGDAVSPAIGRLAVEIAAYRQVMSRVSPASAAPAAPVPAPSGAVPIGWQQVGRWSGDQGLGLQPNLPPQALRAAQNLPLSVPGPRAPGTNLPIAAAASGGGGSPPGAFDWNAWLKARQPPNAVSAAAFNKEREGAFNMGAFLDTRAPANEVNEEAWIKARKGPDSFLTSLKSLFGFVGSGSSALHGAAAAADELGAAHGRATGTSGRLREGLVLLHEFLRGDWKRAVGSATIELQRFGVLGYVFNPITGAIGGTIGAMALLIHRSAEVESNIRLFDASLHTLGTGDQESGAGLQKVVENLKHIGVSAADARKAVATLAQTPGIPPKLINELTNIGARRAQFSGGDEPQRIEELTKAALNGVAGLIKYGNEFGAFSDNEAKAIRDLDRAGGSQVAFARALEDINHALPQSEALLSPFGREILKIKNAWDDLLTSLSKRPEVQGTITAITAVAHAATTPTGGSALLGAAELAGAAALASRRLLPLSLPGRVLAGGIAGGAAGAVAPAPVTSVLSSAATGASVGSLAGLLFPPAAPVLAPVGAAVGGAIGAGVGVYNNLPEPAAEKMAASVSKAVETAVHAAALGEAGGPAFEAMQHALDEQTAATQRNTDAIKTLPDKLGVTNSLEEGGAAALLPPAANAAPAGPAQGNEKFQHLVEALIQQESGGNPLIESKKHRGEADSPRGLGQVRPSTARGLDASVRPEDLYDPAINRRITEQYLRQQIIAFGDVQRGLRAYNAGPGAEQQIEAGRISPKKEQAEYPSAVLRRTGGALTGTETAADLGLPRSGPIATVAQRDELSEKLKNLQEQTDALRATPGYKLERERAAVQIHQEALKQPEELRLPFEREHLAQFDQAQAIRAQHEVEASQRQIGYQASIGAAARRGLSESFTAQAEARAREEQLRSGGNVGTIRQNTLELEARQAIAASEQELKTNELRVRGQQQIAAASQVSRAEQIKSTIAAQAEEYAQTQVAKAGSARVHGLKDEAAALGAKKAQQLQSIEAAREELAAGEELQRTRDRAQAVGLQTRQVGQGSIETERQLSYLRVQQELRERYSQASPEVRAGVEQSGNALADMNAQLAEAQLHQERINELFHGIATTVSSELGGAIKDALIRTPVEAGEHIQHYWRELRASLKSTLGDIASNIAQTAFIKPVTSAIASGLGLGQVAQQIGGFATGGTTTVGGSGGTDSQLVQFMATPGERVVVLTPAQAEHVDKTRMLPHFAGGGELDPASGDTVYYANDAGASNALPEAMNGYRPIPRFALAPPGIQPGPAKQPAQDGGFSFAQIPPGFANGTMGASGGTPPGWIQVGERGPEWMFQPGGATVLPHGQHPRDVADPLGHSFAGGTLGAGDTLQTGDANNALRTFTAGLQGFSTVLGQATPGLQKLGSAAKELGGLSNIATAFTGLAGSDTPQVHTLGSPLGVGGSIGQQTVNVTAIAGGGTFNGPAQGGTINQSGGVSNFLTGGGANSVTSPPEPSASAVLPPAPSQTAAAPTETPSIPSVFLVPGSSPAITLPASPTSFADVVSSPTQAAAAAPTIIEQAAGPGVAPSSSIAPQQPASSLSSGAAAAAGLPAGTPAQSQSGTTGAPASPLGSVPTIAAGVGLIDKLNTSLPGFLPAGLTSGSGIGGFLGNPFGLFATQVPAGQAIAQGLGPLAPNAAGNVTVPGLFGTTATFGSFLAGAGSGFGAGSLLNSLIGGNAVGGNVGAGAGALLGSAIGSFVLPGVGTLLGGLLGGSGGGFLGGLVGGRPAGQSAGAVIGPSGQVQTNTVGGSAANIAASQQVADQIGSFVRALGQLTNAKGEPIGTNLSTAVVSSDNRSGITVFGSGIAGGKFGQDAAGAVKATELQLIQSLGNVSGTLGQVLQHINDPSQLQNAVQFADVYDKLSVTSAELTSSLNGNSNAIGAFSQALTQANSTFTQLTSQANQFGVSVAPISAALAAVTATLNQDFKINVAEALSTAIDGGNDFIASLIKIHQSYVQNINDAKALASGVPTGVTGFANGTMGSSGGTPPGWILVGERGPEWMLQPGGATVLPNGQQPSDVPDPMGRSFADGTIGPGDVAGQLPGIGSAISQASGGPSLLEAAGGAVGLSSDTLSTIGSVLPIAGPLAGGLLSVALGGNPLSAGIGTASSLIGFALGGPIGGVIGGLVGLVGNLFGPKPSNKSSGDLVDLATGAITGFESSGDQKADTIVGQISGGISKISQTFQAATGGSILGAVSVQDGHRDGIKTSYSGPLGTIDMKWGSATDAIGQFGLAIAHNLQGIDPALQAQLSAINDPNALIPAIEKFTGKSIDLASSSPVSSRAGPPSGPGATPDASAPANATPATPDGPASASPPAAPASAGTDWGSFHISVPAGWSGLTTIDGATASIWSILGAQVVPTGGSSAPQIPGFFDYQVSVSHPAETDIGGTSAEAAAWSASGASVTTLVAPVPGFANGGTTPPGWILVGERGPEWMLQAGGATILPNGVLPQDVPSAAGRSFADGTGDWGSFHLSVPAGWSGMVTTDAATAVEWSKLGASVTPLGSSSHAGLQDYSVHVAHPAQTNVGGTSGEAQQWAAAGGSVTTLSAPVPVAPAAAAGPASGATSSGTIAGTPLSQIYQAITGTEAIQAAPVLAGLGLDQLNTVIQSLGQAAPEIAKMAQSLIDSGNALPDLVTQGIQALTNPLEAAIEKERALGQERLAVATQAGQDIVKVEQLNAANVTAAIVSGLGNATALTALNYPGNTKALEYIQAAPTIAQLSGQQISNLVGQISTLAPDLAALGTSFLTAGTALPDTNTQALEAIVSPLKLAIQQQAAQSTARTQIANVANQDQGTVAALNSASLAQAVISQITNPSALAALLANGSPQGLAQLQAGPLIAGLGTDQLQALITAIGNAAPDLTNMINALTESGLALPAALKQADQDITAAGLLAIEKAQALGFEQVQTAAATGQSVPAAQQLALDEALQATAQATGTQLPINGLPDWITQIEEAATAPLQLAIQKEQAAGAQRVAIAAATGADLARVEKANADAVAQAWYQATAPLVSLKQQITGGTLSGLTPANQVPASVEQFNQILKLVQGGNTNFINDLASAGTAAIQASQTAYGNGPQTASIRSEILAAIQPFLVSASGFPESGPTGMAGGSPAVTAGANTDLQANTSALRDLTSAISGIQGAAPTASVSAASSGANSGTSPSSLTSNPITGQAFTGSGITSIQPNYPVYPSSSALSNALSDAIGGTASSADWQSINQALQAGILNPANQPGYALVIEQAQQWAAGQAINPGAGLQKALQDAVTGTPSLPEWALINQAVNSGIISPTANPQYSAVIQQARKIANAQATSLSEIPNNQTAYNTVINGLPAFSAGTDATPPGMILVGEKGPEWYHAANDNAAWRVVGMNGPELLNQPGGATILPFPVKPAQRFAEGTSDWKAGRYAWATESGSADQVARTLEKIRTDLLAELQVGRKVSLAGLAMEDQHAKTQHELTKQIVRNVGPNLVAPARRAVG